MTTLLHCIQLIYNRFCCLLKKDSQTPISEIDNMPVDESEESESTLLEKLGEARNRELCEYWETGIKHDYTSQYLTLQQKQDLHNFIMTRRNNPAYLNDIEGTC